MSQLVLHRGCTRALSGIAKRRRAGTSSQFYERIPSLRRVIGKQPTAGVAAVEAEIDGRTKRNLSGHHVALIP